MRLPDALESTNVDLAVERCLEGRVDPALRNALEVVFAQRHVDDVEAVIIFGSVARGEAHEGSDIDLAVIAQPGWEGRVDLEDAVRKRLGNDCNVLVFTAEDFASLAAIREPVIDEILIDGIPLIGTMPQVKNGVA